MAAWTKPLEEAWMGWGGGVGGVGWEVVAGREGGIVVVEWEGGSAVVEREGGSAEGWNPLVDDCAGTPSP